MANWVMGMKVTMKDIKRTGMTNLALSDVKNGTRGNAVKLLAVCDRDGGTWLPQRLPRQIEYASMAL